MQGNFVLSFILCVSSVTVSLSKRESGEGMHPIVLVIKLAALGTSGHLDFVHLCSMVVTTVLELR